MNSKSILLAAALALGAAASTQAQNFVYITGSTAFRSSVHAALVAGTGGVFDTAPTFTGREGSAANACNYMTFTGAVATVHFVVKCSWSGSEAGIGDIANAPVSRTFLADGAAAGYLAASPTGLEQTSASVDLGFGDNNQQFSRTRTPLITTKAAVGIIPFTWVRNPSTLWGSSLTNISDAQVRQVLNGACRLSLLTGNPADTTFVYAMGRDSGSGTRVNAYGNSGFGIFSFPQQVEIDATGALIDLDGGGTYSGDYGFTSGGTVAGRMGINTGAKTDLVNGGTGFSLISYLGRGDANTAIANGAVELMLNGVQQTSLNVKEGRHTYWGTEYVFQRNGASVAAQTIYTRLLATVPNNLNGTTGIKLTDMNCTRTGPTADPVHN